MSTVSCLCSVRLHCVSVSMTIENKKRRFFDINANNGLSATIQCLYSTKTTITMDTILHYEGMHTITQLVCLICPIKCDYTKLRCYVRVINRLLNYNYNWVRVN